MRKEGGARGAPLRGWTCLTRPPAAQEPAVRSTPSSAPVATPAAGIAPGVLAALEAVPAPRRAAGVVDPLPAILALAVAAPLADHHSVLAVA